MGNTLFPDDPDKVSVIRYLTPDITTFSLPFARFGIVKFGARATLVKLPSGNLLIFSPTPLTPTIRSVIAKTGTGQIGYIVAPDTEHHLHLSAWKTAYPGARIIAPEGLLEKRQRTLGNGPDTSADCNPAFDYIYTAANKYSLQVSDDPEFHATFAVEYVHSHPNREIVLLHKPSRYLIQADLMFNLPGTEQYSLSGEKAEDGLWNRLGMGWMKARTPAERTAQARFVWYVLAAGDRKNFGESIRRIWGWDFGGIVPCHGDVIEDDQEGKGREVFEGVFEGFLKG
ncbi:hypothetical protein ASPFODRAFT_46569 [Aspergillus luchuensis CBS 106.47]|uniref:Metallo-beta-lactamase domain-containing protein n=1 Tax=Aspergillus luchuensis (strain CBS 106.47) TaxID=1137211 RepID=A0A1M3TJP7_ASPLC|nr:hypothetical protein ASPFODRAFT_46569 [Aspergillus luchuensis CBS 106.47]